LPYPSSSLAALLTIASFVARSGEVNRQQEKLLERGWLDVHQIPVNHITDLLSRPLQDILWVREQHLEIEAKVDMVDCGYLL